MKRSNINNNCAVVPHAQQKKFTTNEQYLAQKALQRPHNVYDNVAPSTLDMSKYWYSGQESDSGGSANNVTSNKSATIPEVQLPRVFESVRGHSEYYIYFDTFSQGLSRGLHSNGQITFNISQYNNTLPLENVVAIQIEPFYFPAKYTPNNMPGYFYGRQMFMNINTLTQGQGINTLPGTTFHFTFDIPEINSLAVKLVPQKSDFILLNPVATMNQFTATFTLPPMFAPVKLPYDVVLVRAVNGSNPAQFVLLTGGTTEDIFVNPVDAGTITYPYVPPVNYVVQFFSHVEANTIPDITQRNLMFSQVGHFVTQLDNNSTFTVPSLDFSTVVGPDTYAAVMHIPKNKIAFNIRFTCATVKTQTGRLHRTYE